jgi:cytochrome c553
MKLKIFCILVSLHFFSFSSKKVFAQDENKELKQQMQKIVSHYIEILPYTTGVKELKSKKERMAVVKDLRSLQEHFKNSHNTKRLKAPHLTPSLQVMEEHLTHSVSAVTHASDSFARKNLQTLSTLCMSCHGQIQQESLLSHESVLASKKNYFEDSLDEANFLFLTRNYEKARKKFKEYILNSLREKNTDRISEALNSLTALHLQTIYQPKELEKDLLEIKESSDELPNSVSYFINTTMESLEDWSKFDNKIDSDVKFDKFINTHLENLKTRSPFGSTLTESDLLVSSGVVSRFIQEKPESLQVPKAYLWLSRLEDKLNQNYLYSLSDIYLKKCVQNYSHTSEAHDCYKEYRKNIIIAYSGSAGTFIPDDIKAELEELRKSLEK